MQTPLSIRELRELHIHTQTEQVLYPITSTWLDHVTCKICNEVKPNKMVIHGNCFRLICADDAYDLASKRLACPHCQQTVTPPALDTAYYHLTSFYKPTTSDTILLQNLIYQCSICDVSFKREDAIEHAQHCKLKPTNFNYIKGEQPKCEPITSKIVSHPVGAEKAPEKDSRLIIINHKSTQVLSKFFKIRERVRLLKTAVATQTKQPTELIKLYKFWHKELYDDETISEVADLRGANHIAAFTDPIQLSDRFAFLLYVNTGAKPYTPRSPIDAATFAWKVSTEIVKNPAKLVTRRNADSKTVRFSPDVSVHTLDP